MEIPMPTRRTVPLALAAALALPVAPALAAGPPESAFVPSAFRVETRIRTDIGGDARRDVVLVLVRRGPAATPSGAQPSLARRLVVLKARSDGGYVQIGEGRRVLLCTACGGALFGTARTPVTVRVQRRVVIVEQQYGSREITDQRFRFRSQGALSTRLIGVDVRTVDRLTGVSRETSTNLLTGDRIVIRRVPGRPAVTRRSRVPVRTILIEDVDRRAWR